MFKRFYPTVYYSSTYTIDFRKLYEKGYRGLLTDVDNTLVPHGAPADERSDAFFKSLHEMGWKTCIISNNDASRVAPFAERAESLFVCDAGKPSGKGYIKGMELMGTDLANSLFLGDQLFTDIWGANRAGMRSILVHPVAKDYLFQIRLKRVGEAIIKFFYFRYEKKHPKEL